MSRKTKRRKVPKRVEFVCNVPNNPDSFEAFADVGTSCTPRVFVETDDRFKAISKTNFVGPPHSYYAGDLVGIYTRAKFPSSSQSDDTCSYCGDLPIDLGGSCDGYCDCPS